MKGKSYNIDSQNCAMNNLRYFREISGVTFKQLSKLLNVTVHTYIGFEQEKITIPLEIVVMLSKIYDISADEIFVPTEELKKSTEDTVCKYSNLDDEQRFMKNAKISSPYGSTKASQKNPWTNTKCIMTASRIGLFTRYEISLEGL